MLTLPEHLLSHSLRERGSCFPSSVPYLVMSVNFQFCLCDICLVLYFFYSEDEIEVGGKSTALIHIAKTAVDKLMVVVEDPGFCKICICLRLWCKLESHFVQN